MELLSKLSLTSIQNYTDWCTEVARSLLFQHTLMIANHPYQIKEIEFYIKADNHNDRFTHCQPEQLSNGSFYFHKRGNSFKEANRAGLDITCGNGKDRFGGILIRGIKDLVNQTYFDGPATSVKEILAKLGKKDVKDFVATEDLHLMRGLLRLEASINEKEGPILWTPRVGLTLKKEYKERERFIFAPYRALATPIETRKGKTWIDIECILQGLAKQTNSRESRWLELEKLIKLPCIASSQISSQATEEDLAHAYIAARMTKQKKDEA